MFTAFIFQFFLALYFEIIPYLQNSYKNKSKILPIHQLLTFHHTALWFSFHVVSFFQKHLRASCIHHILVPLMDISKEQGHSLTQPQDNYQRQELNIDQVRLTTVLEGNFLFSPHYSGIQCCIWLYCVSQVLFNVNSPFIFFMTLVL